ncbi:MAG: tryptophan-rich sensory protein [Chloroflexi bacterium]|nr:tryptophan-rich sensory protein [Chloroflexota bacterium]
MIDPSERPADGRDLARQVATVVAFVATVVVNGLANALPINGLTTGEISDRFPVLVVPAGYVFSIWGAIYVGLLAFTVYQALPGRRADPLLRRLGWLPALTGVLNVGWILLWHGEAFLLTAPVMAALLATLVAIEARIRDGSRRTGAERWVVAVPFSVYVGWITVATIANVSATLASLGFGGFGIEPPVIASAVLLVGLGIASVMVLRFRDPAYGLVIAWAYAGIVVKEAEAALVPLVASASALVVLAVVAGVISRGSRGRPERRPAAASLAR